MRSMDLLESPRGSVFFPHNSLVVAAAGGPAAAPVLAVAPPNAAGAAGHGGDAAAGEDAERARSRSVTIGVAKTVSYNKAAVDLIEWRLAHPSERKKSRRGKKAQSLE